MPSAHILFGGQRPKALAGVLREDGNGVHLELAGDLARILHLCSTGTMQNAQAVAGAGRLNVV